MGARRHDVKTPAKKATKALAKAPAKVAVPAKKVSAKSPAKAQPAPAKTKAVTAKAKAAPAKAKAIPAKAPAKPVAKAKPGAAKAPAKTAVKPSAKTAVKAVAKAPAKVPAKAPAKSAAKAVAVKTPPKKAAPSKVSAKVAPAVKAATAAAKLVAVPQKPAAKASPVATPKVEAKLSAPVQAPAVPAAPAAADLPIRSSRPSARLAQITVPSMPQAVASTAAKATFLPSMSTPVLPVPAAAIKKDPKLANNWKNKPVTQLSDAEVLAMSDDEYMNDVQMAYFRIKLVQLKQDILSNAGETTEHLREDTVVVPDPADRATIEEEHALELRTRDRERKLLKKIEQSIARIDAGDYGYCDETGEPIGVGRLLARPTATLSLEAQQRRELKQKMFGD